MFSETKKSERFLTSMERTALMLMKRDKIHAQLVLEALVVGLVGSVLAVDLLVVMPSRCLNKCLEAVAALVELSSTLEVAVVVANNLTLEDLVALVADLVLEASEEVINNNANNNKISSPRANPTWPS